MRARPPRQGLPSGAPVGRREDAGAEAALYAVRGARDGAVRAGGEAAAVLVRRP